MKACVEVILVVRWRKSEVVFQLVLSDMVVEVSS